MINMHLPIYRTDRLRPVSWSRPTAAEVTSDA